MTACSQRQKASMLVEDYLEEALPYPDSYEAIDIYVDSAFAPYDDRKAFEMLNIIGELAEDLENTEKEARQAKASIAMWSRAGSEYELMLRKEAEENLVLSIYKIDSLKKEGKKHYEKISKILKNEQEFIGYKVRHYFSAKNKDGKVQNDSGLFLINKEFDEVTYVIPLSEYNQLQKAFILLETQLKELTPNLLLDSNDSVQVYHAE